MNGQYEKKCDEIFECQQERQDIKAELQRFREYFELEASAEYQYILERYAGIYIREEYGYRALERTPLADESGFESMPCFFPLKGRYNVFDKYGMYRQQLPENFIPIGELDGGNLLCMDRVTEGIYIWIHDEEEKDAWLAQKNLNDLILSFEKTEHKETVDAGRGIVKATFAPGFLEDLRNYKK